VAAMSCRQVRVTQVAEPWYGVHTDNERDGKFVARGYSEAMPVLRGTVATTTDIRGTIKMKPLIPFPFECIFIVLTIFFK